MSVIWIKKKPPNLQKTCFKDSIKKGSCADLDMNSKGSNKSSNELKQQMGVDIVADHYKKQLFLCMFLSWKMEKIERFYLT